MGAVGCSLARISWTLEIIELGILKPFGVACVEQERWHESQRYMEKQPEVISKGALGAPEGIRMLLNGTEVVVEPIEGFFHERELRRYAAGVVEDVLLVLGRRA
jgi:hypothetical protein